MLVVAAYRRARGGFAVHHGQERFQEQTDRERGGLSGGKFQGRSAHAAIGRRSSADRGSGNRSISCRPQARIWIGAARRNLRALPADGNTQLHYLRSSQVILAAVQSSKLSRAQGNRRDQPGQEIRLVVRLPGQQAFLAGKYLH